MQAISSEEPVVLLIDEIDKTDQEFEAMLLELLSDFQITIPELGQIWATTMPIVVLTSNDSRELTEALKRRCLYLWLDYPGVEREMEIVLLHAPEMLGELARRLVEVIEMVRALDLKKPPSIAESIDWARTLLLMGAEDIDRETFTQSMSIIVKHRTDIDLVAERVGMKLAEPAGPAASSAARRPSRRRAGRRTRRRAASSGGAVVGEAAVADRDAAVGGGDHVGPVGGDDERRAGGARLGEQLEEASRLGGSRPSSGSSASRTEKGRTRARAIEAFCFMPVVSSGPSASSQPSRPSRSSSASIRGPGVGDAVQRGDVFEVLADAQVFVEDRAVGRGRRARGGPRPSRAAWPPTSTVPEVGSSRPAARLRKVVLPAPLGPTRATSSPASTLEVEGAEGDVAVVVAAEAVGAEARRALIGPPPPRSRRAGRSGGGGRPRWRRRARAPTTTRPVTAGADGGLPVARSRFQASEQRQADGDQRRRRSARGSRRWPICGLRTNS